MYATVGVTVWLFGQLINWCGTAKQSKDACQGSDTSKVHSCHFFLSASFKYVGHKLGAGAQQ